MTTHGLHRLLPGWRLLLIAGIFALGALAYSLVVPPFEAPDEPFHFAFARHLAQGGGLPVQGAQSTGPWQQEGSQPPLYYALAGLLTARVDQGDYADLAVRNPRANIGNPLYPGNKNFMLYSGASHPLRGANLALHMGRWLSLLLGAATVILTGLTARLAFPRQPNLALLAAIWVAVIPQYAFLSASLTNDALVVMLCAAGLFWMARLAARAVEEPIAWWEWTLLGVILGLAALSKLQGLGLFVLAALLVACMAWQRRDPRLPVRAFLPLALPPLLIAGWWYARNVQLYGDWSGLGHLLAINGRRTDEIDFADWWLEFRGLRYSFWGLFGWFNILLPAWLYTLLDVISLAALAGTIWGGVRGLRAVRIRSLRTVAPAARVLILCSVWAALSFMLLVYWTLRATGSQGRLFFPALSALAILLVYGLDVWLRHLPVTIRRAAWAIPVVILATTSLYVVGWLLPAAYRPPAPVAAPAPTATPANIRFGDAEPLDLLAVDVPTGRYHPGDDVPVTLYLSAPTTVTTDYELFLQLLDENGGEIANVTTHPGWGRNPTSLWQPGAIQQDDYLLRITRPVDAHSPLLSRLYVGFIDPATAEQGNLPLPARNAAGEIVTPFVGTVAVVPNGAPPPAGSAQDVGTILGDVIRIQSAALSPIASNLLTVTVDYSALAVPATDYTAFVHLLDAEGHRVAGYDAAPAGTRFPTSAWRPGDRIQADFALALSPALPAGDYTVWTGLYETSSLGTARLPITDAAGQAVGDGQVEVGRVRIEQSRE